MVGCCDSFWYVSCPLRWFLVWSLFALLNFSYNFRRQVSVCSQLLSLMWHRIIFQYIRLVHYSVRVTIKCQYHLALENVWVNVFDLLFGKLRARPRDFLGFKLLRSTGTQVL